MKRRVNRKMLKKHLSKKEKNSFIKRTKRTKRRRRRLRGGAVKNNDSCVRKCVESCNSPSILTRFKSFISPKPETNVFKESAAPPASSPPAPQPKYQQPLNNNNLLENNGDLNNEVNNFLEEKKKPGLWEQIKDFFKPDNK